MRRTESGILPLFKSQPKKQVNFVSQPTPAVRTFQDLILALQQYWAEQGCVVLQPYDMEVGAGTFHTATFLRAIGPETWNAAYVQPSRRPTDGRYGENPNRLQHYYQFQVVLKPNPDNFQELYLGSLKHVGLDPLVHDIRFVEDNWESPTLGAWGLGWEVWLNGMEVTQFTYFQQAGGIECYPVAFLWSFVGGTPVINHFKDRSEVPAVTPAAIEMSKGLKKAGFTFVGPTICYALMQASGMVMDHTLDCDRYATLANGG